MKRVSPIVWAVVVIALLFFGTQLTPSMKRRSDLSGVPNPASDLYKDRTYTWTATVLATGLDIPWDLAILPNNDLLITERTGAVKRFDGTTVTTVGTIPVATVSESGLTGIALHPKFEQNQLVYLYFTYRTGGELKNKVVRYVYGDSLKEEKTILDGLAGGQIHNGGRLRFGPDEKLYVLTGDAARPALAQDTTRLEGKILRLNDDGSVPADNPTPGSLIYTLGHRNPQGLAWHALTEELFTTEHGETANDEVNAIRPGQNYGWPTARRGSLDHAGFTAPLIGSGDETWAPSGIDFLGLKNWDFRNTAVMAGLRSKKLQKIEIVDGKVVAQETLIDGTYGRLRAVVARGDGSFYVTTSNRDGRTDPQPEDDRLLLLTPHAR